MVRRRLWRGRGKGGLWSARGQAEQISDGRDRWFRQKRREESKPQLPHEGSHSRALEPLLSLRGFVASTAFSLALQEPQVLLCVIGLLTVVCKVGIGIIPISQTRDLRLSHVSPLVGDHRASAWVHIWGPGLSVLPDLPSPLAPLELSQRPGAVSEPCALLKPVFSRSPETPLPCCQIPCHCPVVTSLGLSVAFDTGVHGPIPSSCILAPLVTMTTRALVSLPPLLLLLCSSEDWAPPPKLGSAWT